MGTSANTAAVCSLWKVFSSLTRRHLMALVRHATGVNSCLWTLIPLSLTSLAFLPHHHVLQHLLVLQWPLVKEAQQEARSMSVMCVSIQQTGQVNYMITS